MLHRSLVSITLAALAGVSPAGAQTPAFSRADYASHPGARAIATADFNRDGWPDTANANTGRDTVTILLNRGAAGSGLARAFDIAVGHGPFDIVSSDFNRDGVADLAVANADADTLSILLGEGSGTFRRTDVAAPGNPRGLTAADMNRDGRIDIVYTGFRTNVVQLLVGNGAGAFTPGTGFFGAGSAPQGITAADFNHDGLMDLAVAYAGGGLGVWTMISTGGATARAVSGERSLNVLTAGDFNRDGWTDIAAASTDAARLAVYHGSATGLRQVATHPTAGSPRGIEAADLNNDGLLEIVTANRDANTIGVFVGRRDAPGSFAPQVQFAAGAGSRDVVAADFDHDSLVDLATGNQDQAAVTVLWNAAQLLRSGLVFSVAEERSEEFRGSEMSLGDFDHDGRLDRVTDSGHLTFGDGRRVQLPAAGFNVAPGVADLNRDGHLDIAFLATFDGRNVKLLFGDGRGGFSSPTGVSGGWGGDIVLTDMEVADLNRDGRPDLLVSAYAQSPLDGRLYFMAGNGNGTFTAAVISPVEATSFFALADLDRDGRLDVLTSPYANGNFKIVVLFGDGTGRFTRTSEHPTPDHPSELVVADLNHDGRMDVVAPTFESLHVLLGTAGGLGSPATLPGSPVPRRRRGHGRRRAFRHRGEQPDEHLLRRRRRHLRSATRISSIRPAADRHGPERRRRAGSGPRRNLGRAGRRAERDESSAGRGCRPRHDGVLRPRVQRRRRGQDLRRQRRIARSRSAPARVRMARRRRARSRHERRLPPGASFPPRHVRTDAARLGRPRRQRRRSHGPHDPADQGNRAAHAARPRAGSRELVGPTRCGRRLRIQEAQPEQRRAEGDDARGQSGRLLRGVVRGRSDPGVQAVDPRQGGGEQLGQRLGLGAVRSLACRRGSRVSHRDDVGAPLQSRRVLRLRPLGVGLGRRRVGRGRQARRDDPLRRRGTAARADSDTRGWRLDRSDRAVGRERTRRRGPAPRRTTRRSFRRGDAEPAADTCA